MYNYLKEKFKLSSKRAKQVCKEVLLIINTKQLSPKFPPNNDSKSTHIFFLKPSLLAVPLKTQNAPAVG